MVWAFSNFVENLRTTISKRISIMVKNTSFFILSRFIYSYFLNLLIKNAQIYTFFFKYHRYQREKCYLCTRFKDNKYKIKNINTKL